MYDLLYTKLVPHHDGMPELTQHPEGQFILHLIMDPSAAMILFESMRVTPSAVGTYALRI